MHSIRFITTRILLGSMSFLGSQALVSCDTKDPAALEEHQKTTAELMIKSAALMEVTAKTDSLENELADLKNKLAKAEEELRKAGEAKASGQVVVDSNSGSGLRSCSAQVTLTEPNGSVRNLTFKGTSNSQGQWSFTEVNGLQLPTGHEQQPSTRAQGPSAAPVQSQPGEKPTGRFDIPLVDPFMKPGGR